MLAGLYDAKPGPRPPRRPWKESFAEIRAAITEAPCPRERAGLLEESSRRTPTGTVRPVVVHFVVHFPIFEVGERGGVRSRIALFFRAVRRRGLEPRCPFGR